MNIQLTPNETRVIGCLIEKSLTTPEHYPLSINALTNACNQKSNRFPVLSLSEVEVQNIVDQLNEKRLILGQSGGSSRVVKYKHRFCNTEFSDLQFDEKELGILCVLFLRGPQTPGELRSRTNRLCQFQNVAETESVLLKMSGESKGYVVKLEREPGRRESRYAHLFSDVEITISTPQSDMPMSESNAANEGEHRLKQLEEQVESMQSELKELRELVDELIG